MTDENHGPVDWTCIDLVAFDVDGTLYDQRSLRLRMLAEIIPHAVYRRNLRMIAIIRTYRRLRERLGDEEVADFKSKLLSDTASSVGCSRICRIGGCGVDRAKAPPLSPGLPLSRPARALCRSQTKAATPSASCPTIPHTRKCSLSALTQTSSYALGMRESRTEPHPRGLEVLMARAAATAANILIGDRIERDGLAARRAGTQCLIRSRKPEDGWTTFDGYNAPLFAPFLTRN